MLEIVEIRAEPSLIPMKSPFETARRRSTEAENVNIFVLLSDGTEGRGEASPAPYVTGEDVKGVLAAAPVAAGALVGQDAARVARWSAALDEALPGAHTTRSSVEMAVLDALTRSWGVPAWVYFGGAVPEVRSDLTIPITPVQDAGRLAGEAASLGYSALKIKVGGPDLDEDRARVLAVSRAAPGARIRLDANQAFDAPQALEFVRDLLARGVPVEIMEQPVPADDWDGLITVTRDSPVPVIADETVIDAAAALQVAAKGAAHGVNIKVAKAGLLGALRIIAVARSAGLKLMLGCMLESTLGISASLALACGAGCFDYVDLDGHTLIGQVPNGIPFAQEGELLQVRQSAPGLGSS